MHNPVNTDYVAKNHDFFSCWIYTDLFLPLRRLALRSIMEKFRQI